MNNQDKAAERSTLILMLGQLTATVLDLARKEPAPSSEEYRIVTALFQRDLSNWKREAALFTEFGEVRFGHELDEIYRGPSRLFSELARLGKATKIEDGKRQSELKIVLEQCQQETLMAIDQVPISWIPQLLEAETPFMTYLKIRDAINTANKRVHYFDRYLNDEFFPLYLRNLDRSIEVRLVTTKGKKSFGVMNVASVSKLASQEFTNFQLIQCTPQDLHDRNLRIDDIVFPFRAKLK